ncbi:MAG: queuine tRNA-ribosyltransferase [Phycisphaerales bacterium]|nr:queuine tRNA-ribosyltransferase [Phycisphaerales bacterium]
MPPLSYELIKTDPNTAARRGRVTTLHGSFETPAFMPVGTQGTVKGIYPQQLKEAGAECILGNTYHLMLRPGEKTVAALGDLHRFMSWQGPILTDSGGFQVFSLSDVNKITDEGVTFKSHIDGARHHLTPAKSIQVQNDLGADIIMCFDQCPPGDAPANIQQQAFDRTLKWAELSKAAHQRPDEQSLFGIVQGGTDLDLRARCAEHLIGLDLPGYALGGLAVGEGFEAMKTVLGHTTQLLPTHKPRYLMGVGFPRDIVEGVKAGIDMFDCVMPTRNGRNAYAFTMEGAIRIRNAQYTRDTGPLEEGCDCHACQHFTRGAIRHFFFASEMLGPMLVSLHNTRFYQRLMADIRGAIQAGTFADFVANDPRSRQGPRIIEEAKPGQTAGT